MNLCGSNILQMFQKQLYVSKSRAFTNRNVMSRVRKSVTFYNKQGINIQQSFNNYSKCITPFSAPCTKITTWRNGTLYSAGFHTTSGKYHGEYEWEDPKSEEEVVNIQILDKDGKTNKVRGKIGDNLLYLAKRFEVEMEGACEASLACTTCHVYVHHDYLDLLPEATETEEDLLDQAPFLRENSRLGCQIILNRQLDGIKLTLPAATKNFYVDGHKPTPH